MLENIRLAFQGVWSHKLRSVLTMLGIIIGIAAIITIVSTIKGTNDQIKQNLIGAGNNAVVVSLYQNDYVYDLQYGGNPDGVSVISPDTLDELKELPHVVTASLFYKRDYNDIVYYKNTQFSGALLGIDDNYFDVYGYQVCYGRPFLPEDQQTGRKVAILDARAATSLFSGANPLGETLEIKGEPFVIVGVAAQTSSFTPAIESLSDYYTYADTSSGKVFLPGSTWPIVSRFDEPQAVALQADSTDNMTSVGKKAADLLTERQITGQETNFSYRSEDLLERAQQLQSMSAATNRQLIWIASISLLVGGIGVMNIMLVSVTERTGEIGLKKAIGAKKRRILWQFLTEAAVLTTTGGAIGVLAGIGLAFLLSRATGAPAAISVPAIFAAVAFSMVIGVVFGLLPATKAANLSPIDALRRE